jgi:hypothetical protein
MTNPNTIPADTVQAKGLSYPSDPVEIAITDADMIHIEQDLDLVSLTPSQALQLAARLVEIAVPRVKLARVK